MNNIFCIAALVTSVGCLPFEADMTAGNRAGTSVEEGNLLEGDIIALKGASFRNLVRSPTELWPNKVFPYTFSDDFGDSQKFNVETALADLAANTCVQFRVRTWEPTYVVFKSFAKICASVVGYTNFDGRGGEIPIYVSAPGCEMRGQIQHEILHSLGFWHEHARPDRDDYVAVHWENIQPGSESNFDSRSWSDTQTLGVPYDLDSVMHYGGSAFSKDGQATLTAKFPKGNTNMGQRFRFSKLDIAKLNRLYQCDNRYYRGNDLAQTQF